MAARASGVRSAGAEAVRARKNAMFWRVLALVMSGLGCGLLGVFVLAFMAVGWEALRLVQAPLTFSAAYAYAAWVVSRAYERLARRWDAFGRAAIVWEVKE